MAKQTRYYWSTYEDKHGNMCVTTVEGEWRWIIKKLRQRIARTWGRILSVFTSSSKEDLEERKKNKKDEWFL